ncbi:MAG: L-threonylcarbamoyladenylate synthase [Burkholderiales bacterium]|nr:L-threonylcarbamoyladenylate synthase [Burkholderiales bacterium]
MSQETTTPEALPPGEAGAGHAQGLLAEAPPPPEPPHIKVANDETIAEGAALLRAGELVAFPTETVYGLGADALNPDAVAKIFKAKGRPADHPVIVHLAAAEGVEAFAREIPDAARRLARQFWPGPLTLVLKRAERVPGVVTGGQDTVALRVPSHPVAQALLAAFGGGVAAPSANKFGRVSPTTAEHVGADFGTAIPLILDGGASPVGIESTIVDLSGEAPRLLRPGGVPVAAIEQVLGAALAPPGEAAPRAPGRHGTHYAPRAHVKLVRRREMIEIVGSHKGRRVAALALEVSLPRLAPALQRVVPAVAAQYAHELYASLRALDATGADVILVEQPPQTPAWAAVNDRLRRAAGAAPASDET